MLQCCTDTYVRDTGVHEAELQVGWMLNLGWVAIWTLNIGT